MNGIKSGSKPKDGFMVNIGSPNSRTLQVSYASTSSRRTPETVWFISLAQYSVMSN